MDLLQLNRTASNTARNYLLNVHKTVPATWDDCHRFIDNKLSTLRIEILNYSIQECKTNPIPPAMLDLYYTCSSYQRNGLRILNNGEKNILLFSAKANPELQTQSNLEKSTPDELSSMDNTSNTNPSREGRPTLEQIELIKKNLSYNLPLFFVQIMDFGIYSKDLIFINNIKGTTTQGLFSYYFQMSLLKIYAHIKFMYVKFHVLKITSSPEDDSVKIRWRINGISGTKIFTKLFEFNNPFKVKETINKEEESWYDGFSTFYINDKGKIYKHVADKMMPNNDQIMDKKNLKIPFASAPRI